MKNAEYWRKEAEKIEKALHKKSEEYYKQAEKQFRIAEKKIADDIEKWYARLADNNDISLTEARKFLDKDELEEFKWTVEEYIKHGKENGVSKDWQKELENASAKYHIRRLETIQTQIQQHIELLYTGLASGLTEHLTDIYKEAYYRTVFGIQKGFGLGTTFAAIDGRRIRTVLDTCWAADGRTFSDRIWQNKTTLVNELNTILTQSIIRGENPGDYITALAKKMNTSRKNASRLIYTESAFIASQADQDCYKELGIEEFEFLATLDSHTSEICREMDGKHFKMSEYQIGVNAPPLHPHCRSTTVPYFNDEFTAGEQRAARDENGDTYYVPADMKYEEWHEKYVVAGKEDANKTADYLFRNHTPGQNTTQEKLIVNEVISEMPPKVQEALQSGTVIDIGKVGASQYDYVNDILYIAKGAGKSDVIHEIGHMVENKILNAEKVEKLKEQFLKNVPVGNIAQEIFYDASGNPKEIFMLKHHRFVSEYQGRLYINDWSEIYDENWNVKSEIAQEFISEPFREYIENPERLKNEFSEFYDLIEEAMR